MSCYFQNSMALMNINTTQQDLEEKFLGQSTGALFVGVSVEIFAPSVAVGMPVRIIKIVKLIKFYHLSLDT